MLLLPFFVVFPSRQLLRQHYSAQYPDAAARNRYPTVMLKVTVLPSSVDVNLTPDKTQVLLHEKVSRCIEQSSVFHLNVPHLTFQVTSSSICSILLSRPVFPLFSSACKRMRLFCGKSRRPC